MRGSLALTAVVLVAHLLAASPAGAQTLDELEAELAARKAELAAQVQINELLKQRIETLEAELAGRKIAAPPTSAPRAGREAGDPEEERAVERALVRRGTAVLSPYTVEVAPGFAWGHSGSDFNSSTQDSYVGVLDARIGLPAGVMVGGSVPFYHRDVSGVGDNSGIGDVSATLWKSIIAPDDAYPSLVGSLRYTAPTGDDFIEDKVPLGSGFHSITGRLSSSKSIDPIAFYGDVSYTHFISETISGLDIDRSGVIGFGAGANLAVTPDITVSTGFRFAFEQEVKVNGAKISGSDTTIGQVDIGAGFVVTRDIFLNLNAAVGVTDDSPDVFLQVSLPIRFP
jgi:hypothetical protein